MPGQVLVFVKNKWYKQRQKVTSGIRLVQHAHDVHFRNKMYSFENNIDKNKEIANSHVLKIYFLSCVYFSVSYFCFVHFSSFTLNTWFLEHEMLKKFAKKFCMLYCWYKNRAAARGFWRALYILVNLSENYQSRMQASEWR